MLDLLGRFHPLIVHFPIALFCTYIGIELFLKNSKKEALTVFNTLLLQIGCISSLFSLLTGYILSLEESNPQSAVDTHKWIALSTTALFLIYYALRSKLRSNQFIHGSILVILLTCIGITGHQGGSLTHGDNFLFQLEEQVQNDRQGAVFAIEDMNQARVYEDVVQFTLNQKCVPCHGQDKQKGKLRLDDQSWISKGGKGGTVLNISNPSESELLKRILLDDIDEHHMPPKEKQQLTEDEKSILTWWINSGIRFNTRVQELNPDSSVVVALNRFKMNNIKPSSAQSVKRAEVSPLDSKTIHLIENAGWVIQPLSQNDNHIRVIGYNITMPVTEALDALKNVNEHVVEMKLSFKKIDDRDALKIMTFKNLEKLWIDHTQISDAFFTQVNKLEMLKYINLSFTNCTEKSITLLSQCQNLERIYGYQTQIKADALNSISTSYPKLRVVLGDTLIAAVSDTLFARKTEE